MYRKHNNEALLPHHCCRLKAVNIIYAQCVSVALVMVHGKRKCRVIFSSSVACTALACFSTLSHKQYAFRGGGGGEEEVLNTKRDLSLQRLSETYHSKKNPARNHNWT